MKIGDEVFIRAKVVNVDSNPHGSSVQVTVKGFIDRDVQPFGEEVRFWIHRIDKEKVIQEVKP